MSLTNEYKSMVAGMRATFVKGKTKDMAWRRQQLEQLHLMIAENHEEITAAVRADLGGGKLRGIGEASVGGAVNYALENLSSWSKEKWVSGILHRQYVRPEPKGVVLIIAPWNFPFQLSLSPLAPAIAAGNCAVIKPSELNPACAPVIERLVKKYLDPECIKVVQGAVPETTALLEQQWDHIFYTGNGSIGRIVMQAAAKHLTPVTLELGGKSPVIIDESAQMDAAVSRVSLAKFLNGGQVCVSPDYVLVHESRADEFISRSKQTALDCFGEDGKSNPEIYKIVNERHVGRIKKLIETSGGEVVCGGASQVDESARYVPPTIIKNPKLDAPIMQDEIFGPVMPVIPYTNLDEALKIVQEKDTPLALYVYSENAENIEKVLSAAGSGGACVNSSMEHLLTEEMPFGGKGPSGMGCYHGKFGFDELSHRRAVLYKSTLPGARSPAFPLPSVKKPTPDFVYDIAIKLSVTGFLPRGVYKAIQSVTPSMSKIKFTFFVACIYFFIQNVLARS